MICNRIGLLYLIGGLLSAWSAAACLGGTQAIVAARLPRGF
jgi:hypothetical protein